MVGISVGYEDGSAVGSIVGNCVGSTVGGWNAKHQFHLSFKNSALSSKNKYDKTMKLTSEGLVVGITVGMKVGADVGAIVGNKVLRYDCIRGM